MTYFEEGRTYYLNQVNGGVWDWKGRDSLILAHASVDFMAPLFYGDQPIMHVRCGRIGSKSFDLEYLITVERDGKPAKIAESKSIMVFFDYEDQASKAVPDEIRRKFSEFEGREL